MSLATKVWIGSLILEAVWSLVCIIHADFLWQAILLEQQPEPLNKGTILLIQWSHIQSLCASSFGFISMLTLPGRSKIILPYWMSHLIKGILFGIVLQNIILLSVEVILVLICVSAEISGIHQPPHEPDDEIYVPNHVHKMLEISGTIQLVLLVASCILFRSFMQRLDAAEWPGIILFLLFAVQVLLLLVLNLCTLYLIKHREFTLVVGALNNIASFGCIFVYGLGNNLPQSTSDYSLVDVMTGFYFASGLGMTASILLDILPRP